MKKGFTLIELLAVIVILAIIALIATPIVLNIIKDSRESAGLRSAEMYLDAVEQSISVEKMNNTSFNPKICTVVQNGNLDCEGYNKNPIEVKVNGGVPKEGSTITFEKGKIKLVALEYPNGKIIVKNNKGNLEYGNYVSLGNYQHQDTNGTIQNHDVKFDNNGHGTCTKCNENVLEPGLYDTNNNLIVNWNTLVNEYGLDIETDYTNSTYNSDGSMYSILNNNSNLSIATKIIIPITISKIGNYAFADSTITSVEMPNSLASIGRYAFSSCSSLTSIIIPNSVTEINAGVFAGCRKLTSITIPDSVINIKSNAFTNCTSLKSVYIPISVTSIANNYYTAHGTLQAYRDMPFYGCSSDLKIYCGAESKQPNWYSLWNVYYGPSSSYLSVKYNITREEYESTYKQ